MPISISKIIQSPCLFCIAETFYLFLLASRDEDEEDEEEEDGERERDRETEEEGEREESEEYFLFRLRSFFDLDFLLFFFDTLSYFSLSLSSAFLGGVITGCSVSMPI